MPTRCSLALMLASLAAVVAVLAGCGSEASSSNGSSTGSGTRQEPLGGRLTAIEHTVTHVRRTAYWNRVRKAIIRGEARDYAAGTRIGGLRFQACLRAGLREALDPPTISNLVEIYRRPGGTAYAAQALNSLAFPAAAECGHPYWVPELVDAASGLRVARPTGAAVRRLGVTYGPYLGVRCGKANHPGCGRVGIDVVFRHAATRVVALVGGDRLVLRTPGKHDGVRYRDWVGTLTGAGFYRRGSPFFIHPHGLYGGRAHRAWAGSPPVYVAVQLRVRFADGRHVRALFPHVFVSPGWG